MSFFKKEVVIYKESNEAKEQLAKLEELLPRATGDVARRMEKDIALLKAGIVGEENILFELKNSGMDMVVLHDVYLECEGLSAQIDYYVILSKVCVAIECKNLFGNIEINNNGDFIRTFEYNGRKVKEGIYSPITQNQRHLEVLKTLNLQGANMLQKAFIQKGFENNHKSLVVLSNPKTILNDRYAKKDVKQKVIRADQLIATLKKMNEESTEPADSMKQMKERAENVMRNHVANRKDYAEKYESLIAETEAAVKAEKPAEQLVTDQMVCPQCGGTLRMIKGQYGDFYGCGNYHSKGCTYKRKV